MPDLTFDRTTPQRTPVRMVCMYCGRPAAHADQRRVVNPKEDPEPCDTEAHRRRRLTGVLNGLTNRSNVTNVMTVAVIVLATIGWLFDRLGRRDPDARLPPLTPPDTVVTITTCGRHRWSAARRRWGAVAAIACKLAVWAWYVARELGRPPGQSSTWLILVPILVSAVAVAAVARFTRPPVRVTAVARDTVVVGNVSEAYFDSIRKGSPP